MNNDLILKLGTEPGMILDLSDIFYVKTFAKETENTLLQEIDKILLDKEKIHIGLSGGLDSQFVFKSCISLHKKITAYTYRTIWNDIILNTDDLYTANLLCKQNNVEHHIIDINLNDFFDKKLHLKYGHKYLNSSPQLAVHFYFIELLKKQFNIDHILLGGDPPLLEFNPNVPIDGNFRMAGESFYQDVMAPYYLFCNSIGVECLRDIYFHSPEAVYCSYKNNVDVVKKQKIHYEKTKLDKDAHYLKYQVNRYKFKFEYYKNIIPDLIPQISETTGFEKLKKILAMETGIYNQFDILYRYPMRDLNINSVKNKIRDQYVQTRGSTQPIKKFKQRNILHDKKIAEIYSEFCKTVISEKSKKINQYSFDF